MPRQIRHLSQIIRLELRKLSRKQELTLPSLTQVDVSLTHVGGLMEDTREKTATPESVGSKSIDVGLNKVKLISNEEFTRFQSGYSKKKRHTND